MAYRTSIISYSPPLGFYKPYTGIEPVSHMIFPQIFPGKHSNPSKSHQKSIKNPSNIHQKSIKNPSKIHQNPSKSTKHPSQVSVDPRPTPAILLRTRRARCPASARGAGRGGPPGGAPPTRRPPRHPGWNLAEFTKIRGWTQIMMIEGHIVPWLYMYIIYIYTHTYLLGAELPTNRFCGLVHPSFLSGRLAPLIPLKSPGWTNPPKRFVGWTTKQDFRLEFRRKNGGRFTVVLKGKQPGTRWILGGILLLVGPGRRNGWWMLLNVS